MARHTNCSLYKLENFGLLNLILVKIEQYYKEGVLSCPTKIQADLFTIFTHLKVLIRDNYYIIVKNTMFSWVKVSKLCNI